LPTVADERHGAPARIRGRAPVPFSSRRLAGWAPCRRPGDRTPDARTDRAAPVTA